MYEARQNKEKVSRRIDGGGGSRQRVKMKNCENISANNKMFIVQRLCYSISGGDHSIGTDGMGTSFPDSVINTKFQKNGRIDAYSAEMDTDAYDGTNVSRTRAINYLIGQIDHIVPKNLGGGGLESNSRVISADKNESRGDDFSAFNNIGVNEVVMVHNGKEYTRTSDLYSEYGSVHNIVKKKKKKWIDPWNKGALIDDAQPISQFNQPLPMPQFGQFGYYHQPFPTPQFGQPRHWFN